MTLRQYEFADPARLIEEIAQQHRFQPGTALLAVVEWPSTRQDLIHVEELPVDARIDHYLEVQDLLYETMQTLPVPDWAADTRHSVMTVVVRPGLTVLGPHEAAWLSGWRYSNHGRGAFSGDLILVTEHGWADFVTRWGDHHPRMVA
jgi:hypothetical protein